MIKRYCLVGVVRKFTKIIITAHTIDHTITAHTITAHTITAHTITAHTITAHIINHTITAHIITAHGSYHNGSHHGSYHGSSLLFLEFVSRLHTLGLYLQHQDFTSSTRASLQRLHLHQQGSTSGLYLHQWDSTSRLHLHKAPVFRTRRLTSPRLRFRVS